MMYPDGIIVKVDRSVIPKNNANADAKRRRSFRRKKCCSRARMTLFWPGMNADIEETVALCSTCQLHRNTNQKETMISYLISTLPWQVVASDMFNFDDREYVLDVDYYSNYPEVEHLTDTRSATAINKSKRNLGRHGKCQKLVSDNGP